jgi:PAS domain S-box-containing protein
MFDWDMVNSRGHWNPEMAAIYNFQPKGQYITAEEWLDLFHPEDISGLVEESQRAWGGGQGEFNFEFRAVGPSGEIKWILSHGRIVRDAAGKPIRMIGIHTDVTSRNREEAGRLESEERFRAFFHSSAVGALRADVLNARFLEVNDTFCHMTGYARESFDGLTFLDLVHPEDRASALQAFQQFRENKLSIFSADMRYIRKDGSTLWAHTSANLVHNEHGQPAYAVALISDTSGRRRLEGAL